MQGIKEDNVFKIYKRQGRAFLILRISLPCSSGDSVGDERLRLLYGRLRDGITEWADSLAAELEDSIVEHAAHLNLDVSFTVKDEKGVHVIYRKYLVKRGGAVLNSVVIKDVLTEACFFAKEPKNVIKQRNIPSRNAKNITKRAKGRTAQA